MNFNRIDLNVWNRTDTFHHYMNQNTSFSLTHEIDISALYKLSKQKEYRFYPVFIFLITSVMNSHQAFRTGCNKNGELGYWDTIEPLYTIFDQGSESFSAIWTRMTDDFNTFYDNCIADISIYKTSGTLFPKIPLPENAFSLSMIPWTSFTGFNLNINNSTGPLLPIITAGRFVHKEDSIFLPLSLQVHHSVCDGYHAGLFMNTVQELASYPKDWLL